VVERGPDELGLGTLELLAGVVVGAVGIGGVVALVDWDHDGTGALAAGTLLALPALQGLAACGVGKRSPYYVGDCAWPIAGAYLGAAALAVPLVLVAAGGSDDPLGGAILVAMSLGVGVVIGAPIGATWAWNVDKRRSPEPGASPRSTATPGERWHITSAAPAAAMESPLSGPPLRRAPIFRLFAGAF
jgi:hypothetical protein